MTPSAPRCTTPPARCPRRDEVVDRGRDRCGRTRPRESFTAHPASRAMRPPTLAPSGDRDPRRWPSRATTLVATNPARVDHSRDHSPKPARRVAPPSAGRVAGPKLEQQIVQRDPHRARLPARAAQRRRLRQLARLGILRMQQRREHGTDRPRVHRAVRVAADVAVHGAHVEARAAPDAVRGPTRTRCRGSCCGRCRG